MIYIDVDKAMGLLAMAIKQRGTDYVYMAPRGDACSYVHTLEKVVSAGEATATVLTERVSEPGCLIGLAMSIAGVSLEQLVTCEGDDAQTMLRKLQRDDIADVTERGMAVMQAAQLIQDKGGETWGMAWEAAYRKYHELTDDMYPERNPLLVPDVDIAGLSGPHAES